MVGQCLRKCARLMMREMQSPIRRRPQMWLGVRIQIRSASPPRSRLNASRTVSGVRGKTAKLFIYREEKRAGEKALFAIWTRINIPLMSQGRWRAAVCMANECSPEPRARFNIQLAGVVDPPVTTAHHGSSTGSHHRQTCPCGPEGGADGGRRWG